MTGEEAEITEGVDEEMESMRAASSSESPSSQRAERANSPTAPAQETRVDRRPRASVRLNHSRAGQERGTLRQAGGNPQRWHETVKRNDQNPSSIRSRPLARTTHRTGSAARRHQRRRRR